MAEAGPASGMGSRGIVVIAEICGMLLMSSIVADALGSCTPLLARNSDYCATRLGAIAVHAIRNGLTLYLFDISQRVSSVCMQNRILLASKPRAGLSNWRNFYVT